jgi:hypothetical protein
MTGAVEDFLDHGELDGLLLLADNQPDHDSKK